MLEQLQQLAELSIEKARAAGATDAFATVSRQRRVHYRQRDDEVERVEESTSRSLSLRLWVGSRYSEHSTNNFTEERLDSFIADAVQITRALDEDRHRLITEPSLYENRPSDVLDQVDSRVQNLDPNSRTELCREIASSARRHDRVISATIGLTDIQSQNASASSNGFQGQQQSTQIWMSSHVTLRDEGDRRPDGFYGVGATHLEDLPTAAVIGARSLARATARLGSIQGPTSRTTMIVEPWMAGGLVSRLLTPATAEAISQERSYFREKLGEMICSERLTLADEPLIRRGLGSRHFDSEGISARRLPLIENGRASTIYVDTYYGRKIDMNPTTGSMSNIVMTPGEHGMERLIADAGNAVLVTTWLGGNSDPTTGEFSIGLRGHLVEEGRIGQAISEMNVSGNLLQLFQSLTAIGNDPWMYGTYRVPTLVFENVQFSGT